MAAPQVNYWLGSIIQMRGEDMFRMKGVIAIRDFPDTFVFQVTAKAECFADGSSASHVSTAASRVCSACDGLLLTSF